MAYYLVRAVFKPGVAADLHGRLFRGEFQAMSPFGNAMTRSLKAARWDPAAGEAVWEEECYCPTPLEQERDAVYDHYFDAIRTERVDQGKGWAAVAALPPLWEQKVP